MKFGKKLYLCLSSIIKIEQNTLVIIEGYREANMKWPSSQLFKVISLVSFFSQNCQSENFKNQSQFFLDLLCVDR